MNTNKLVFVSALAMLAACGGKDSATGLSGTTGTTGNTGTTGTAFSAADVTLTLDSAGVALAIANAPAAMDFGIVEQGGCGDQCWEAESCEGETAGYSFCHDAGTSGVALALVSSPDDVVDGSTTLFSSAITNDLGYVLDSGSDCYTWGAAGSYWSAWSCTAW